MRLIDADALMEMFKDLERYYDEAEKSVPPNEEYSRQMWQRGNGIRDCIIDLISAPSVEAIPMEFVGEWTKKHNIDAPIRLLTYDWFCKQKGEEHETD